MAEGCSTNIGKDSNAKQESTGQKNETDAEGKLNQNLETNAAAEDGTQGLQLLYSDHISNISCFGWEEGFYYFIEDMHLMYVDYATRQEVYLCSDSSCQHEDDTCASVFSTEEFSMDSVIFMWKDKLYVLNRDFDDDGTISMNLDMGNVGIDAAKAPSLYCMEKDGTSREKIFTFPSNTTLEKIVMGKGNMLWFVSKELTYEQKDGMTYTNAVERKLVGYDSKKNEITKEISLQFEDGVDYGVLGGTKDYVILYGSVYPDGMTEEEVNALEEVVLAETEKNYIYFSTGDALCCLSSGTEEEDNTLYFIDKNTGEIQHSALTNVSLGWMLEFLACSKDEVLLVYDYDATDLGDGAYEIHQEKYALIKKEDLYQGVANYLPINMAERTEDETEFKTHN